VSGALPESRAASAACFLLHPALTPSPSRRLRPPAATTDLYICLSWLPVFGIKLEEINPAVAAWHAKIAELSFVKEAHAAIAAASPKTA